MFFRACVVLLSLSCALWADPLASIHSAYEKAAAGARLKFVYGMLSHRTADYELIEPGGRKFDLGRERDEFARMFDWATKVDLQIKVLKSQARGTFMECRVEQTMTLQGYGSKPAAAKSTVTVRTQLDELWTLQSGRWKLRASRVLSQTCHPPAGKWAWR